MLAAVIELRIGLTDTVLGLPADGAPLRVEVESCRQIDTELRGATGLRGRARLAPVPPKALQPATRPTVDAER